MTIERVGGATLRPWHAMRARLYPQTRPESLEEAQDLLANRDLLFIVALDDDGEVLGFAEGALRHDYVNGCETSPVVFLEGIYVEPHARGRGIARELSEVVGLWGRERGCTEFASDSPIDNLESHAMHRALGFEETERVVYFRKPLA